jgi:hypothetical protein
MGSVTHEGKGSGEQAANYFSDKDQRRKNDGKFQRFCPGMVMVLAMIVVFAMVVVSGMVVVHECPPPAELPGDG